MYNCTILVSCGTGRFPCVHAACCWPSRFPLIRPMNCIVAMAPVGCEFVGALAQRAQPYYNTVPLFPYRYYRGVRRDAPGPFHAGLVGAHHRQRGCGRRREDVAGGIWGGWSSAASGTWDLARPLHSV